MQKINLNLGWRFHDNNRLSPRIGAPRPEEKLVDLPHDFIYTKPRSKDAAGAAANGYFGEGRGTYEKNLEIPAEWIGKKILLDIDGAYMNAEVILNGRIIDKHPYGYTAHLVDLSDYVREGDNRLVITTQSRQPSTRWYSGGGLYRSVALWVGEPVCVEPWDVFISTPEVSKERALVRAQVDVTTMRRTADKVKVTITVEDAEGQEVATGSVRVTATPGAQNRTMVQVFVEDPKLWDTETPYLYTMKTTVTVDGQPDETLENKFGIRKYEVDSEKGLRLNDKPLKLKGGCIHHDAAFLGAAAWPRAEERKIQILKAAGYNSVRISHYPPSLEMLEVCDREGIILLDEAFDTWQNGKVAMDYHLYFEEWWERDIEFMVKRDRNHPCVFTYSIGNEIGERDGSNDGYNWAHKLADKIRSLDNTHFITSAINGTFDAEAFAKAVKEAGGPENVNMENLRADIRKKDDWGGKTASFAAALDIVGYNYLFHRYENDKTMFPGRVIMGTETHPFNTYDYWKATMDNDHVIGDFVWTAYDNLGEAGVGRVVWDSTGEDHGFTGPWPWRSCFQGDMDLCGYRTGQSYFREIMWEAFDGHSDKMALYTTHPCHNGDTFWGTGWHWRDVEDTWTFDDEWLGKPVKVDAYADADEVEFFLNGVSCGKAPVEKLEASLEIPYEKGTVEAVAYRDGKEIARCCLKTTGKAAAVTAEADRPVIKADRQDLSYVALTIVDAEGARVPYETSVINIEVSGAGRLAGIGSGNPCTEENYGTPYCKAYEGRAMAAVVADEPGEIVVKVWVDSIGSTEIKVVAE